MLLPKPLTAALVAWFAVIACVPRAQADEVDFAVDAVVTAGGIAGVPIDKNMAHIAKAIVRCAANKRPVLECARDEVVNRVIPAEGRQLAKCLLDGKKVQDCALDEIVARLPGPAQAPARCLVNGTPVADCVATEVINRLPSEVKGLGACIARGEAPEQCAIKEGVSRLPAGEPRQVAECVMKGRPVSGCAADVAIAKLPEPSKGIARCIVETRRPDQCAVKEGLKHVPADAQKIADCIATRGDIGQCGKDVALGAAQAQVFEFIDKFKADARSELGQANNGALRNIIDVAQGIKENDWVKVSIAGGTEVYKAAGKIVLNVLLTPALAPLIGPIVDVVVQNRVDLLRDLVKGLKTGDSGLISRVVTEAYLMLNVEIACALPMPDEMRRVLCGTIGKVIRAVGGVAHDVGDAAGRVARDALKNPLNIPVSVLDETIGRLGKLIDGKRNDCPSADNYYLYGYAPSSKVKYAGYAQCLHRGAYMVMIGQELDAYNNPASKQGTVGTVNNWCRNAYLNCHDKERLAAICDPLNALFARQVHELHQTLGAAAWSFSVAYFNAAEKQKTQTTPVSTGPLKVQECPPPPPPIEQRVNDFIGLCENYLAKVVPLVGDPTLPQCGFTRSIAGTPTAHREACKRAVPRNPASYFPKPQPCIKGSDPVKRPPILTTLPPVVSPAVDPDKPVTIPLFKTCPNGKRVIVTAKCPDKIDTVTLPPPCPPGFVGERPACRCPEGTQQIGETCRALALPPPPVVSEVVSEPARCIGDLVGTPPDCFCPEGTREVPSRGVARSYRCEPIAVETCPPTFVGQPPNCRCPEGARLVGRRCIILPQVVACPAPLIGNQPDCRCPDGRRPRRDGQCLMVPQVVACPAPLIGNEPNCRCPNGRRPDQRGQCRVEPEVVACRAPLVGNEPNCRCPDGRRPRRNGECPIVPQIVACAAPLVGNQPDCRCPDGRRPRAGNRCDVAPPPPCPPTFVGQPPNCRCPDGTRLFGRRCQAIPQPVACRAPLVGVEPNCRCPAGQRQVGFGRRVRCIADKPPTDCGPGYRPLDKPNKYGARCELIPKPTPPTPPPPTPPPPPKVERCPGNMIFFRGRCRCKPGWRSVGGKYCLPGSETPTCGPRQVYNPITKSCDKLDPS